MTIPHPAPGVAHGREPGPNQWFKDHLDSVIDAEFMKGWPAETAGAHGPAGPYGRAHRTRP
ncbi:hypothetical protein [Streptomyces sp. NPDC017095]|uniref:hypothetical protein n=1 Tax=unclassified Streptomyces TaxID=2593676 RepID=UPI00379C62DD